MLSQILQKERNSNCSPLNLIVKNPLSLLRITQGVILDKKLRQKLVCNLKKQL